MEIPNTTWIDFEASKARANLAAAGIDMSAISTHSTPPTSELRTTIAPDAGQLEDPARVRSFRRFIRHCL